MLEPERFGLRPLEVHRRHVGAGLPAMVVPLPHLHTASIVVCVRVGSRYESREHRGISHLLEHLLFRGSEQHPSTFELNREVESLGGTLEAATAADHTAYWVSLPPEHVPRCLEILGDMLARPVLHGLELERRVVREEILESLDEDGELIDPEDLVHAALFGDHPLAASIGGTLESLERIDDDAIRAWHAEHYGARNASVCIAGAVSPEPVLSACERAFAALPAGERRAPAPFERYAPGPGFRLVETSGSQSDVRVAVPAVPEGHRLRAASELLGRVVDDGLSSWLFQEVVERTGLAYDVFASQAAYLDAGCFVLGTSVEHGKVPAILRSLLGVLARLKEGPNAEELERARLRHVCELRACLDDAEAIASLHAEHAAFGLQEGLAELTAKALAVTADDAREAASALAAAAHLQTVVVGSLDGAGAREARALATRYR